MAATAPSPTPEAREPLLDEPTLAEIDPDGEIVDLAAGWLLDAVSKAELFRPIFNRLPIDASWRYRVAAQLALDAVAAAMSTEPTRLDERAMWAYLSSRKPGTSTRDRAEARQRHAEAAVAAAFNAPARGPLSPAASGPTQRPRESRGPRRRRSSTSAAAGSRDGPSDSEPPGVGSSPAGAGRRGVGAVA
jgi:hypothetical protein